MQLCRTIDYISVDISNIELILSTTSHDAILYRSIIDTSGLDHNIVHVVVTNLAVLETIGKHIALKFEDERHLLYSTLYLEDDIVEVGVGTALAAEQHLTIQAHPTHTGTISSQFRAGEVGPGINLVIQSSVTIELTLLPCTFRVCLCTHHESNFISARELITSLCTDHRLSIAPVNECIGFALLDIIVFGFTKILIEGDSLVLRQIGEEIDYLTAIVHILIQIRLLEIIIVEIRVVHLITILFSLVALIDR